jgi:DNA mismatch repair protein MutS
VIPVTAPVAHQEEPVSVFRSILFEHPERMNPDEREEPAYFYDLHIDQIVASVTAGHEEYDLASFFHERAGNVETIQYRHEILRDLEKRAVFEHLRSFADKMRQMRQHVRFIEKDSYSRQQEGWFLDAVKIYCDAVECLTRDLASVELRSRGLLTLREYLADYVESLRFTSMMAETMKLKHDLAQVRYYLHIKGSRIKVSKYDTGDDYSADVQSTFERFKQGAVKDYRLSFSDIGMNHVEAALLDLVARLFSDVFTALGDFCDSHRHYLDDTIGTFDREVQFYISYLEYIEQFKSVGLSFCYPDVSMESKGLAVHDAFDLALANTLVPKRVPVVCNDLHLDHGERIIVVSGPNQGGKTTFARMFGQLHHFANIGLPVPGSTAELFLFDQLFTHFGREEDRTYLAGKLEEDLVRIRDVLNRATTNSIIIMNEIFTSTTLKDSLMLGKKVLEKIVELDLLCVYVTFVDELASFSESTVSMVSTIVPENPAERTYKVVRLPADGLAYAYAIAEKYGLSYKQLKERIAR